MQLPCPCGGGSGWGVRLGIAEGVLTMSLSAPFIKRPVATFLLTFGVLLGGYTAYRQLPVASLPAVDFPTVRVYASLPGASPETMASAVATPPQRQLRPISQGTQLTSSS